MKKEITIEPLRKKTTNLFSTLTLFALLCLTNCSHSEKASDSADNSSAENNRKTVLAFYHQALIQRQTSAAFERYMSEDFIDHKATMPLGTKAAAIDYLENLIRELPNPNWEVVRTIAEGDLVFLHARFTPEPNAPAYAIGDVFRLENDKIVEHWDIIGEPVKEQRNPNSRF